MVTKVSGLIIAAGLSSRMGYLKPLVEWNGKTFLSSIIDKLKIVCDNIIIVTGNESEKIEKYVKEYYSSDENTIACVFNPNYLKGMFSSLKKGTEASKNSNWIIYHQVDQPNLPSEFYQRFVQQIDKTYDWVQPRDNKDNGHPIIFGKSIIKKIRLAQNDSNLRVISNSSDIKKKYWECEYPEIFTDIDTKQDLYKLK